MFVALSRLLPAAAVLAVLTAAQSATAARLLQVFVEQDGKVVLHTFYEDNGRADAATVWRYLQDHPIMVDDDVAPLEPPSADALQMSLQGDLKLRIQHVERVIAEAQLKQLALQRDDAQKQTWFLPAAEVERTASVAGLPAPIATKPDLPFLAIAAATMGLVLLFIVGTALCTSRWAESKVSS